MKFLVDLEKFSCGKYVELPGYFGTNKDIHWYANAIGDFSDENISEYYKRDEYSRLTRWDFWNTCLPLLQKNGIKTLLDIGAGNGHFVYLCLKKGMSAFGIEPRVDVVSSSEDKMLEEFKERKIYRSTLSLFLSYVENNPVKFDCVTILNFLHAYKDASLFEQIHRVIPMVANYFLCSVPDWENINIHDMFSEWSIIEDKILYNTIVSKYPENANNNHRLYFVGNKNA